MALMQIGPQDAIYYEHKKPTEKAGVTFVFFNALTGSTDMWEAVIAPLLREAGHGTLLFNFRGQTNSPFSQDTRLDSRLIVGDARKLMEMVEPVRPVLVGLSIGGLFAAQTLLNGADASGLVFLNTLRRSGPRLQWINDAMVRCTEVGGMNLLRDLFFPLLFNEEWLAANRSGHLKPEPYTPIDRHSGHYLLLKYAGEADWGLPYERLTVPALVVSGLQDHIFFDAADVDRIYRHLPKARRVDMADAGHLIPVERPKALAEMLITFAEGL